MSEPSEASSTDAFGPVLVGGRDRSRGGLDWRRIALYVTAFVGTMALTTTATLGAMVYAGASQIDRVDLGQDFAQSRDDEQEQAEPVSNEPAIPEVEGVQNILVVGNDSREGLSDEQLLALGTEDDGSRLTDTVILMRLDASAGQASVLSFPRDLLVERCDGSRGRINSAFAHGEDLRPGGGPACLVQTVTALTGLPVDHYVGVNFAGFIQAVDAVGGVTFHIDEPIRDVYAGLDVEPGCVTFDGTRALGFVRARHLDGGDFGRIARQQRFLRELVTEATSVETLSNPRKVFDLVNAVGGAITTDRGLSTQDIGRLAYTFRELSNSGLTTYTVPGTPGTWGEGAAVVNMDEAAAQELFAKFRDGSIADEPPQVADVPGEPAPEASPTPPGPADVPAVLVQNGAGVPGLADVAAAALTERGFDVLRTENADNFGYMQTRIVFPPEQEELAEILGEALPDADLDETDDSQLTVVLGADFDPDELPEPPEPSPTPEPEPEAEADDAGSDAEGGVDIEQDLGVPEAGPGTVDPELAEPDALPSPGVTPTPEQTPLPTYAGAELSEVRC